MSQVSGFKTFHPSGLDLEQPAGFSVCKGVHRPARCVTLMLSVCVVVSVILVSFRLWIQCYQIPLLCLFSTGFFFFLSSTPLLSLLSLGFHYQIPPTDSLCTPPLLLLSVFRPFPLNVQTLFKATKTSSPMWAHSHPSCPLKGGCVHLS